MSLKLGGKPNVAIAENGMTAMRLPEYRRTRRLARSPSAESNPVGCVEQKGDDRQDIKDPAPSVSNESTAQIAANS